MNNQHLFFIALIPFKKVRDKVDLVKHDFAERFGSSKALKVPSHITLKAPFICNDNAMHELLSWFMELRLRQGQFNLLLKDFAAFHNKYSPVVYINPVMTPELVTTQQELITGFRSLFPAYLHPVDIAFKPHMTVAYRDLSPDMFQKAWREYQHKKFEALFEVNAVHLLKHDTIKWQLVHSCSLKN